MMPSSLPLSLLGLSKLELEDEVVFLRYVSWIFWV